MDGMGMVSELLRFGASKTSTFRRNQVVEEAHQGKGWKMLRLGLDRQLVR